MLLVADVHGEFDALARVARSGEPLLILGDLLNFIDYRTLDGLLADVAGKAFVAELVALRSSGQRDRARNHWRSFAAGREQEIADRYDELIGASYRAMAEALTGSEAYVTYGNVDRPDVLAAALPEGCRFMDAEVAEVEGVRVGFAGGGAPNLGVPGEVTEARLRQKLNALGPVDMLCTHVAPAVRPLSRDVIGGAVKESAAVLEYLERHQPAWHYFGDIHQPQARTWRVGRTRCVNVGYFRATRRAIRHG